MNSPNRNFIPRSPSGSDDEARRFIVTHEQLHPVRRPMPRRIIPPAAPGGGLNFVGEIDLTGATSYKVNDFGFISSGNNMGAYICNQTTDALSNPPWTGTPYWSMWPNSSGQYM